MNNSKTLMLTHSNNITTIDSLNNIAKVMLENNVSLLDYQELYYKFGFQGTQSFLLNYIDVNKIDTIIFAYYSGEFFYDLSFLEKLRKNIFLVRIAGDTEHFLEIKDQYDAQVMDLIIVNSPFAQAKLHQMGFNSIVYFEWFNGEILKKYENISKNIDVSFVGLITGRNKRFDYINFLLKNGINIRYFGHGSSNGIISIEEKTKIFNSSKINLNFSDVAEQTILTRKHKIYRHLKGIKGNNFEIALCGGFILSEYAFGIEKFFRIDDEISIFYDKTDLLEKIRYYLQYEKERERIAKNCYEKAVKNFNAKLTIPKLLFLLNEFRMKKKYKRSEIYLDEEFIKNHTTFRIFLILKFLKARKWRFVFEELKIIFRYRKLDWWQIFVFIKAEVVDSFPKIKSFIILFSKKTVNPLKIRYGKKRI